MAQHACGISVLSDDPLSHEANVTYITLTGFESHKQQ